MFKKYLVRSEIDKINAKLKKHETLASIDQVISGLKSSGMSHNTIVNHLNKVLRIGIDDHFSEHIDHNVYCSSLIVTIEEKKIKTLNNSYFK